MLYHVISTCPCGLEGYSYMSMVTSAASGGSCRGPGGGAGLGLEVFNWHSAGSMVNVTRSEPWICCGRCQVPSRF